jgi:hypothetical protein
VGMATPFTETHTHKHTLAYTHTATGQHTTCIAVSVCVRVGGWVGGGTGGRSEAPSQALSAGSLLSSRRSPIVVVSPEADLFSYPFSIPTPDPGEVVLAGDELMCGAGTHRVPTSYQLRRLRQSSPPCRRRCFLPR